jgi:hypothetical protein
VVGTLMVATAAVWRQQPCQQRLRVVWVVVVLLRVPLGER